LTTCETSDLEAFASLETNRSGTAHGLAVWFDSELVDNVQFSNKPGEAELIYGQAFFPFPHPVEVQRGDQIDLSLKADLVSGDYVWRWDTSVFTGSQCRASFTQSTLYGIPLSAEQLLKRSSGYKPTLTEAGHVRSLIMELMTADNSLEEIARRVAEQFAERYPDWKFALDDVTLVSLEFGK
jgi:protein arginine N-methyltransferase 1